MIAENGLECERELSVARRDYVDGLSERIQRLRHPAGDDEGVHQGDGCTGERLQVGGAGDRRGEVLSGVRMSNAELGGAEREQDVGAGGSAGWLVQGAAHEWNRRLRRGASDAVQASGQQRVDDPVFATRMKPHEVRRDLF